MQQLTGWVGLGWDGLLNSTCDREASFMNALCCLKEMSHLVIR